jgi:hypothetical protein
MKSSSFVFAASLAANLALVGVIVAGRRSAPPPTAIVALQAPAKTSVAEAASAFADRWSLFAAEDLTDVRDRLRAEGFPASTIRAILAAQIRARHAAERKAIERTEPDAPFWKPVQRDAKTRAALRELDRQQEAALRALVGPDPHDYRLANLKAQLPNLAPERFDQLAAIQRQFEDERSDIYNAAGGPLTPEERERINGLEKAMHAEFAGVLTPAELEDYDLRASRTAEQLRSTLQAFDANEAEFRALYKLQAEFNEKNPMPSGPSTDAEMRARGEAQKQLRAQIADTLGAARYADYQRATDYNYRITTQLVARLGLPPETANNLYALQKEYQDRRVALRRDATDQAAAAEQMQALQAEATTRVTTLLGGNAASAEAYKQHGGGWLRSLAPPSGRKE